MLSWRHGRQGCRKTCEDSPIHIRPILCSGGSLYGANMCQLNPIDFLSPWSHGKGRLQFNGSNDIGKHCGQLENHDCSKFDSLMSTVSFLLLSCTSQMVQRYEMLWEYKALASSQMRRRTPSLSCSLQLPWGLNWSCSGQLMPFSSNKCMLQIMQMLQTHFPNTSDMNFSATRKRPAWNSNTKCKVAVVGRSLWSDVKCTFLEKNLGKVLLSRSPKLILTCAEGHYQYSSASSFFSHVHSHDIPMCNPKATHTPWVYIHA